MQITRHHLVEVLIFDRAVVDPPGFEGVVEVLFGGGAGADADGFSAQVVEVANPARSLHHQPLTIVEDHGGEAHAVASAGIAAEVERGVARQQVDFSSSQGGESFRCREGSVLNGGWVADDGSGKSLAEINVEA